MTSASAGFPSIDSFATGSPVEVSGSRVRVVFGSGVLATLGELVREEGGSRVLIVTDPGVERVGHLARAQDALRSADLVYTVFPGVEANPSIGVVERGLEIARRGEVDFIVGLGGGSSLDSARGINFVLTNGGSIRDYWGIGKASRPLLPMIGVPTTAGTGSEAQSFALITDPETHQKMPCGDDKALCRVALLDPELTATQPRNVACATGLDAISHAVESSGTRTRNPVSRQASLAAWHHLSAGFERAIGERPDVEARSHMLLGSHLAGVAIENSMLGAAHACANPLTAYAGLAHGFAVSLMLPHVVRWNTEAGENPYQDLSSDPEALIQVLEKYLRSANLPLSLSEWKVGLELVSPMAQMASTQWTGTHNPRALSEEDFRTLYRRAMA